MIEEKQAEDITLIDLRQVSVLADYFVICTSASDRQSRAILDAITVLLKQDGVLPFRPPEGGPNAGWILLDYGDVVVHVFSAEARAYYGLEQFWQNAQVVLKMQ